VPTQDSVNEVLRKVGKNILLFQHLEHLLKFVVANGKIAGYVSELENIKTKQQESINKQTMGQLIGQYIENTNPKHEDESFDPEEVAEAYLSFSFHIETDLIYYETKKEALAQLVFERNQLVHHLLPKLDMNSDESCRAIEKKLDEQSEKIRSEIEEMKSIAKVLDEGRKTIAEFLGSEEGKKQFELSFLRQSRIVLLLGDIATQIKRTDGWTFLSTAGHLIKKHAPEELAMLKERHGYKSLKSLILATEIFDVYEEATQNGGNRVLYRLKPGWELSKA
jgi:hypothetical protein